MTVKIEWDGDPTETQYAKFVTIGYELEQMGLIVELIGRRPDDRG